MCLRYLDQHFGKGQFMVRRMLIGVLVIAVLVIGLSIITDRRADLREAATEARYPPLGELVMVDGRAVHVLVKGEGPDLVVIHGASGNVRDMEAALGDELTKRYRVFFVDRPGHGWTERLGPEYEKAFTTKAESPAEQAHVLSQAVTQLGAENPIVLGHSYGGAVAMAWGLDQPASALVILAGVTMPWPGEIDITYRVLGSRLGSAILAPLVSAFLPDSYVANAANGAFFPQKPPNDYVNRTAAHLALRIEALRANNRMVNSLLPNVIEQSQRYEELSLPIELLHGDADQSVRIEVHSGPLSEKHSLAKLTVLDGIGHMPHHSAPIEVGRAVDRALKRAEQGLAD